jgi:AcrR family transcriptional regulator
MRLERSERPSAVSERHRDLIEALEALFLDEGFRTITVDELAARLKCSKRTLYELAPSKQELFLLVVERWLHRIRHLGWAGALKHDDPEKRIIAYLDPGVSQSRTASRRFLEDLQSYRPALALLEAHQRERTSVLRDIVEDGMQRGRFRRLHPALVAEVFQAAVGRLNEPDFLDNAGISFSDGFSELYELFLNGLFSQPKNPD